MITTPVVYMLSHNMYRCHSVWTRCELIKRKTGSTLCIQYMFWRRHYIIVEVELYFHLVFVRVCVCVCVCVCDLKGNEVGRCRLNSRGRLLLHSNQSPLFRLPGSFRPKCQDIFCASHQCLLRYWVNTQTHTHTHTHKTHTHTHTHL